MFSQVLLAMFGAGFGLLAAAGVFTVFVAVGLVPRFAGRTHTANKILLYEEMVVLGTIAGGVVSVFDRYCQLGAYVQQSFPQWMDWVRVLGDVFMAFFGLFSGMFVGCLALAIAEMLDSIPIFTRRISLRHGIGIAILVMAVGKLFGSLFYFITELHAVVP